MCNLLRLEGEAEKERNPTANYLTLLSPLLPLLHPPRGKSMIGCFNICHLRQHPPTCVLCKHTPSLTYTHTRAHMSLHLLPPHQIGRQSVECASAVLLCRLWLVVCDLSTALMHLSLNPRSYLMISLPLCYSPSPFISTFPSGGHTMDCFLVILSSRHRANCLVAASSRGLMCHGARGCSSCLHGSFRGEVSVGVYWNPLKADVLSADCKTGGRALRQLLRHWAAHLPVHNLEWDYSISK